MTLYAHYSQVKNWRWPNFTPAEIACKGTGEILVNEEALDRLQFFRKVLGLPVLINSAYRSERHNQAVGGAPKSKHRQGIAFDIRITPALTRELIHKGAKVAGFGGIGDYDGFVHIDTGPARYWDLRK